MKKRILSAVLSTLLLLSCLGGALAEKSVNITFTGDVTLGSEELKRKQKTSFITVQKEKGNDWFFANWTEMFHADDLTVINLEGTLTDKNTQENKKKVYRFRGETAYVDILTGAGIEAANLSNNHTMDFGNQGYAATKATLNAAGIGWFNVKTTWIFEKDGIRIAFFGFNSTKVNGARAWFRQEVPRLKQEEGVDAVVFIFHAGSEYSKHHTKAQESYAHWAIDAGADLVIMHHPHVVQGVEVYKDRYICYSLGNFCFGGNKDIRALECLVAGVRFDFNDDGTYVGQELRLYPAHISGNATANDYQPRLVKGEAAAGVMNLVQIDTPFDLPAMDDEAGYVLMPYLWAGGYDPFAEGPAADPGLDFEPEATE